jgi:nitroimidazol reductase NimA-like FMN-containing flavoprotein (pyridoxamine 5'-phosphate oxidase superfamily)
MTKDRQPRAESLDPHRDPTTWLDALDRLEGEATHWLATVRPDGRPHLVPVLAVWVDGTVYFCAGPSTRKARNLMQAPHCAISARGDGVDIVVEGRAAQVTDESALRSVAEAYVSAYGWHVTVRDGAFHEAEGAPTAGPPPYGVFQVRPITAFGFGTDETVTPTRWSF